MAKTRHNNLFDTIDDILTDAKKQGTIHLYTEDDSFSGRTIRVKNRDMFHFGTTGYLGLEQDERLKNAAIDAIKRYGTQFPLSKTYISHSMYAELEELLNKMYGMPVIVCKNSTLAHIGVIPGVVRDEDAVILDHQVHSSVQNACQLLKPRNIHIDMIRHNNLDMLEDRIKSYGNKYQKIYYMADGVYSMYGDCAPVKELVNLMEKYPALHVYIDDVHGMSWSGPNGTGFIKSILPELHPKLILISTLSKTFGASGATVVIPDSELYRKIKTFGGPLSFSAQLEPAAVGAAVASAKIHLSDEIYQMQSELMMKVDHCNALLRKTEVPLVEENNCPVFFIGAGLPTAGYNLVSRLLKEGYYINLGIFPAVPIKNTGVRFTISRHNKLEDIEGLVEAIGYHYPKALAEEGYSIDGVRKAFRMAVKENNPDTAANIKSTDTLIEHFTTIQDVKKEEWDRFLGGNGVYDYNGLLSLEKAFTKNKKPEDNWRFHYIIVRDKKFKPVLMTFLTSAIWKDDMLAPKHISIQIEKKREGNPYYLTSRYLSMGSLISEGDHLYLDKDNDVWEEALIHMLNYLTFLQEKEKAEAIVLRDFDPSDIEIKDVLLKQGYFTVTMPETCIVQNISFKNEDEYLSQLSARSRKHVRTDIFKTRSKLIVEHKDKLTEEELQIFYNLYSNVAEKNFDLNYYQYPFKLLEIVNNCDNWEFTVISLKEKKDQPLSILLSYRNTENNLIGVIIGLDYEHLSSLNIYKHNLYNLIFRAVELECKNVFLGLSATLEKKKFGASAFPKVAYMQTRDNYKLELLENISAADHA